MSEQEQVTIGEHIRHESMVYTAVACIEAKPEPVVFALFSDDGGMNRVRTWLLASEWAAMKRVRNAIVTPPKSS